MCQYICSEMILCYLSQSQKQSVSKFSTENLQWLNTTDIFRFWVRIMRFHLKNYEDNGMNKKNNYVSPDIGKLQEVIIDLRTRIYIALGADPKEAKKRYLLKHGSKLY